MTKKIVNGKTYNTDTAKELGYQSNGYSRSDFNFCEETLYRKKNGEYFLYGHGGAYSNYGEIYGSHVCGGSKVIPLSEEKAKKWAEENLTAEEYIDIFGGDEEFLSITSDSKQVITQIPCFSKDETDNILEQLQSEKALTVYKEGKTVAVVVSPEEYQQLLTIKEKHLSAQKPEK